MPGSRLASRIEIVAHAGRGRECSCCGARWRRFAEFNGRADSLCLRCGSLERHRALALHLRSAILPKPEDEVLHFAPEPSIGRLLEPAPGGYLSVDLEPGLAMMTADITALPLAPGRFGLVLCSHVLEHVADERSALAELRRVCANRGRVLVMVPRDPGLPRTDEDPSVTDPAERRRRFLQEDHVRLYGRDLEDRLAAGGFAVETSVPALEAGRDDARRFGLRVEDEIFSCSPA